MRRYPLDQAIQSPRDDISGVHGGTVVILCIPAAVRKTLVGGVVAMNGAHVHLHRRKPHAASEPTVLSMADHATAVSHRPAERFDELFRELYPRLVPLAERLLGDRAEAEDVVQEAFLRLARSRSHLLERPDEVVGAWLRRVVLNLGINRLRDRRRADARLLRATRLDTALDPERDPGDDDSPSHALLRAEARDEVRAVLAGLPARQRACLLLRHAGHSYAEIAATLGIAIGSVGVYLARGERAFRAAYRLEDHVAGPVTEQGTTP
jgi:RNA polymerase sigma-70 factor (ECF subfamily)